MPKVPSLVTIPECACSLINAHNLNIDLFRRDTLQPNTRNCLRRRFASDPRAHHAHIHFHTYSTALSNSPPPREALVAAPAADRTGCRPGYVEGRRGMSLDYKWGMMNIVVVVAVVVVVVVACSVSAVAGSMYFVGDVIDMAEVWAEMVEVVAESGKRVGSVQVRAVAGCMALVFAADQEAGLPDKPIVVETTEVDMTPVEVELDDIAEERKVLVGCIGLVVG